MLTKEVYFISDLSNLTFENIWEMGAALYGFQFEQENEKSLISLLENLLNDTGWASEMYSIQTNREQDGVVLNDIQKMGNAHVIVIEYNGYSVVLYEDLALQFIIDYCEKFSKKEQVKTLCLRIMKKFQISYNTELSRLVDLSDVAWKEKSC